jgi:hypothetical protein
MRETKQFRPVLKSVANSGSVGGHRSREKVTWCHTKFAKSYCILLVFHLLDLPHNGHHPPLLSRQPSLRGEGRESEAKGLHRGKKGQQNLTCLHTLHTQLAKIRQLSYGSFVKDQIGCSWVAAENKRLAPIPGCHAPEGCCVQCCGYLDLARLIRNSTCLMTTDVPGQRLIVVARLWPSLSWLFIKLPSFQSEKLTISEI